MLRMAHRKWKETKQQPSMLLGPAVPGCSLDYFHILWAILSTSTVHPYYIQKVHLANILRRRIHSKILRCGERKTESLPPSVHDFIAMKSPNRSKIKMYQGPEAYSVWVTQSPHQRFDTTGINPLSLPRSSNFIHHNKSALYCLSLLKAHTSA